MKKKINFEIKKLSILFLVAFLIKLPFILFLSLPLMGDAESYLNASRNLAQNQFYSVDGIKPEMDLPLGYPILLSLIHIIFGFSVQIPLYFHVIFSAIECVLIYLLCKKLYSERAAYFAYGLFVLLPGINLHLPTHLSENASMLFITLFVFMWFHFKEKKSISVDIALGICLAWLIYSRTAFIAAIPMLALGILLWKDKVLKQRALICIGIVIFVMLAWSIRNKIQLDEFSFSGDKGKLEFYMGTRVEFDGQAVGHPQLLEDGTWWCVDKNFQNVYNQYPNDPNMRKEVLYNTAINDIKENPIGITKIGLKGMFYYFWFPPYAYNFFVEDYIWNTGYDLSGARFAITYIANLYYVAWVLFIIFAIYSLFIGKLDDFKIFAVGTCIIMSALLALFQSVPRYHTAVLPLLIPLAACGFDHALTKIFGKNKNNRIKSVKKIK